MTNELGIELKCENCERCCEMSIIHSQRKFVRGVCLKNKKVFFKPLKFILVDRIKELQEQQFTEDELKTLKEALEFGKDKFKFLWVEKLFDESLKIVERILKNSEAN